MFYCACAPALYTHQIKEPDPAIEEIRERTNEVDRKDGAGSRIDVIDNKYAASAQDSDGRKMEKKLQRDLDYKCEGQKNMQSTSDMKGLRSSHCTQMLSLCINLFALQTSSRWESKCVKENSRISTRDARRN